MSKVIERIKSKAEELAAIRLEIAAMEEAHRVEVEAKKERRDAIQNELLAALRKEDLASIKTTAGETYARSIRRGVDIVNAVLAMSWARDNGAVAIDRRIVAQKLAKLDQMPPGFELTETEFISVRKPKNDE